MRRPGRLRVGCLALLAGSLLLGACAGNQGGSSAQSRRERAARFKQPAGLVPETIVIGIEPPEDRNGNGFADTIRVVTYVFGDPNVFPLPMVVDANFQFRLVDAEGRSIGVWAFPPNQVARAVFTTQPGPAFGFELDINAVGTDRLPTQAARLTCEINTVDGARVLTRDALEVRIGGRM